MNSTPVDYIARTREQYDALGYEPYRWAERPDAPSWTPLTKPVADSTVVLVASGGAYRRGHVAFHWNDDTGIRMVRTDEPAVDVRLTHFAYDLVPAREDPNIVFPVDRLHELADEGVIGGLAPEAVAFMGGIYSVRLAESELVPHVVDAVTAMDVDLALLVPV
ncbi:MAG: glycine/sarcosine/betaine reductase selenoprotein B family protein [Actinomycetota bacterium]|nr:glycine/sarcosine/betaine reductase selenoprotein B family protein [Actinomycetota bacterium]MEE3115944.1 glycine/sarcosine/betaine reductase selenoprotein B family protein [Actinomycetota bacterium]